MTSPIIIGIDPGVNTGAAVWDIEKQVLIEMGTMSAIEAMELVAEVHRQGGLARLVIEDARLRKFFGAKGREALQGAGSIKRDCSLWGEFCAHHVISMHSKSPLQKGAKVDAVAFRRLTGWEARTSEHSRDAAMLVFGTKG